MVVAVRGAIQIESNKGDAIKASVIKLVERVVKDNSIGEDDIVSILFSQTTDITEMNPAPALRETGYASVPLFFVANVEYRTRVYQLS